MPAFIIYTTVVFAPVLMNLFYSLTDWDGYQPTFDFIGLENFAALFSDSQAQKALVNTLVFTAVNAPLQVGLGVILALSLEGTGPMRHAARTAIVLPIAISGVVLGFLGTLIFDPRVGLLIAVSEFPGLGWLNQNWFGEASLAMGAVIFMNLWQFTGLTMLIFLAGLAAIPQEAQEAATLDGVNAWQRFRHVTWPLLAPAATINIVLIVIGGLKVFDIIYVLTGGGPGGATESIVMRVLAQDSFGNFGYSATLSLTLTLITFGISVVLLAYLRRREVRA